MTDEVRVPRPGRWLVRSAAVLLVAIAAGAGAQEAPPADSSRARAEPLITDRPDFTESPIAVPRGRLQLESGISYQWRNGGAVASGPELLARYGLRRRIELRLGLPDYGRAVTRGRAVSGFGDTYVGVKLPLGPLPGGSELALIPAVSLPSRRAPLSSGSVDPELKLTWSRALARGTDLSLMAFGLWTTADDRRRAVLQQTVSLGHDLGERLGMFIEWAGTFARGASADHVAHVGLAYLIGADMQVDIHGGASVNGTDHAPFIAGGYSVRF